MATAKLLGAFISTMLTFVLAALANQERYEKLVHQGAAGTVKLSAGFLLLSITLYLSTMYSYDSLLLPVPLWSQGTSHKRPRWVVTRPPSSANRVLYQNMIHIWTCLFTPATYAVIIALVLLSFAVFHPEPLQWDVNSVLGGRIQRL